MTIQFSAAVRNGMLDAIETAIGVSAKLQIWSNVASGTPANCAATNASNVKLVEYSMASDWAGAASAGVKSLSSLPLSIAAVAAGTAAYYRFTDAAGTTCHEQGTVTITGSGGDMTIDNTVIAAAQTVQVTGFTKTAPGA